MDKFKSQFAELRKHIFANHMEHFDRPRKIDAHTHIGAFGSPFDIDSPFHHPTVEIQKVMACGVDECKLKGSVLIMEF